MPRGYCHRHGQQGPCTCSLGNLYRFVEPLVLYLLQVKGRSYGYDLAGELNAHALTDSRIDPAALYRTLRTLEQNGHVVSEWDTSQPGPARRVYRLTESGRRHLGEWLVVLEHLTDGLRRLTESIRGSLPAEQIPAGR